MKRILIPSTSWEQQPLLERARAAGYWVLATDYRADGEARHVADAFELVPPHDLAGTLAVARKHGVDGVASLVSSSATHAASFVADRLGLPGPSLSALQRTFNKAAMRSHLAEFPGVHQPRFALCRTYEEALTGAKHVGWPLVIKPVDNAGARGVKRVRAVEALHGAFCDALQVSASRQVILEEMIEGVHLTIDGFAFGPGQYRTLVVAEKRVTTGDHPIIMEVAYPPRAIPEAVLMAAVAHNERVVCALDIASGPTHGEYILEASGRPVLVEIANRAGGVHSGAKIIPAITGIDCSDLVLQQAAGLRLEAPSHDWRRNRAAVLRFLNFEEGHAVGLIGLQEALAHRGILDCRALFAPPAHLRRPQWGAERHAFVIAVADDRPRAEELVDQAASVLRPLYRQGSAT